MLQISNVFAIGGLVFLTFAMASVVFLITNVLCGTAAALPVALVVLAVLGSRGSLFPCLGKSTTNAEARPRRAREARSQL
jgi:hypothetical protein